MRKIITALNNKEKQCFHYFDIVTAIFVVVLILSNIASSAKIIDLGVSVFNIPLVFDAGTLLFPISYIFGDILTEVYGFKRASRVIILGFLMLTLSSFLFWIVKILPGEKLWELYVGQRGYEKILGGMSSGGIVLASLSGYLAGSFSNALVMDILKKVFKNKLLWIRTITSTFVGEFFDTAIFILIGILTSVFLRELYWSLTLTNYIFKVTIEVIMTPLTYLIVNFLKQREGLVN